MAETGRWLRVGQRVVMTRRAQRYGLGKHSTTGRVVAVHSRLGVMVQRDGLKRPEKWASAFWRPARWYRNA